MKLESLTVKMESLASLLVEDLKQGKQISSKDHKFLRAWLKAKKNK